MIWMLIACLLFVLFAAWKEGPIVLFVVLAAVGVVSLLSRRRWLKDKRREQEEQKEFRKRWSREDSE